MSKENLLSKRENRREFLKRGAGIALSILPVPNIDVIKSPEQNNEKTFADIFGVHALGGGDFKDITISDLKTLNAKSVVLIEPDREMLAKLFSPEGPNGTQLITRIYSTNHRYNHTYRNKIAERLSLVREHVKRPYVIPFNEPNLPTADDYVTTPEKHANDFIGAALYIHQWGGIPLIPSVAQNNGEEREWRRKFLTELKNHPLYEYLILPDGEGNIRLASDIHAYSVEPGHDPRTVILDQTMDEREILNLELDTIISEFGVSIHCAPSLSEEEMADETERLIALPLVPGLENIVAMNWWLLADDAQVQTPIPKQFRSEIWNSQALRTGRGSKDDVTLSYKIIENATTKSSDQQDLSLHSQL